MACFYTLTTDERLLFLFLVFLSPSCCISFEEGREVGILSLISEHQHSDLAWEDGCFISLHIALAGRNFPDFSF